MTTPEKIYATVLNGHVTMAWSDWREDKTDVEYIRADIHEARIEALKAERFTAGARALFDRLVFRVANHWHSKPEIDKVCQAENAIITEWATDALEDVSPESCAKWRNISVLMQKIADLNEEIKKLKEIK